ncbi:hypothetical protein BH09SUM1_BH09SUM1_00860 [soil metagenome]
MGVYDDILSWSEDLDGTKADFWRGGLRRLVVDGKVDAAGVSELASICKAAHGMGTAAKSVPLAKAHLSADSTAATVLTLDSISNVERVNTLSTSAKLTFVPTGLTVVYGDNGSGKSGYTRILKKICRSRGRQTPILADVFENPPGTGPAKATVTYTVAGTPKSLAWSDGTNGDADLRLVSVFDSLVAETHVGDKCEVAYVPDGIRMLKAFCDLLQAVEAALKLEKDASSRSLLPTFNLGETPTGKLVKGLTPTTTSAQVEALATLTEDEKQHREKLRVQLAALQSEEHRKKIPDLRSLSKSLRDLKQRLSAIWLALSPEKLESAKAAVAAYEVAREAVAVAAKNAFGDQPLKGVGEPVWLALWDAARLFSQEAEADFPPGEGTGTCVLCLRPLDADSNRRFRTFEEFVKGKLQAEERRLWKSVEDLAVTTQVLAPRSPTDAQVLAQLEVRWAEGAPTVEAILTSADAARTSLLAGLALKGWDGAEGLAVSDISKLDAAVEEIEKEAKQLEDAVPKEEQERLGKELAELDDRSTLSANRQRCSMR